MIFRTSASSLERVMLCQASDIVPIRITNTDGNEFSEFGTAKHNFIDSITQGMSRDEALSRVTDKYRKACELISSEFLAKFRDIKTELSFAVDLETGGAMYLGNHLNRDYPDVGESYRTGTCDIMAVNAETGIPVLADMKSGRFTTECSENWQIRFLAYAMHYIYNYPKIECHLIYLREGEDPIFDTFTFEEHHFKEIKVGLLKLWKELIRQEKNFLEQGVLELKEGVKQCEYCPAMVACPAKIGALVALGKKATDADLDKVPTAIQNMTNEQAKDAWVRYKKVDAYWKLADKQMKEFVKQKSIDLGNGKSVAAVTCKRSYTDDEGNRKTTTFKKIMEIKTPKDEEGI